MHKLYYLLLLLFCSLTLFAQPEYTMSNTMVFDCEGVIYDSGGLLGNYASDESYTFAICPDPIPACIQFTLNTILTEQDYDYLQIFDGSENGILLGQATGFTNNLTVNATSGCITLVFKSDGSFELTGFRGEWTCYETACPEIPTPQFTVQDCIGAIPICQTQFYEENAYLGTGGISDEINSGTSCLDSGEKNDVWYVFTVQQSGVLSFLITPNTILDDYDWAVYNVTNSECSDIFDDPSLEISCNYSGTFGLTGPNGDSNLNSQAADGTPFNATIDVLSGQTYVINISQYTDESQDGYTIDFSSSTAVILDNIPPTLNSINTVACGDSTILLNFSENILCSSIDPSDFIIEGPDGIHLLSLATSICATDSTGYEKNQLLKVSPSLTVGGSYFIALVGEVTDVCGNIGIYPDSLNFEFEGVGFIGTVENVVACGESPAIITVMGQGNYNFYNQLNELIGNGTELDVSTLLTNENPNINIKITKIDGNCESEPIFVQAKRINTNLAFTLSSNTICKSLNAQNPFALLAPNANGNGTYSINNGGIINPTTGEVDLQLSLAGNYIISSTLNEECTATYTQELTILPQDNAEFTIPSVICLSENTTISPDKSAEFTSGGTWTSSNPDINIDANGIINFDNLNQKSTFVITYSTQGECAASKSIEAVAYPDFTAELTFDNDACLNNGTDEFKFTYTVLSNAIDDFTFEGDINKITKANAPKTLTLSSANHSDGINFTVSYNNGFCSKTFSIAAPICPSCTPNAGTMPSETIIACSNNAAIATTNGEFIDDGATLTYILHTKSGTSAGNILASSSIGTFSKITVPAIIYYQTYYISAIVGFDKNNDEIPDLNDNCTAIAPGTPVIFLAPIQFLIDEHCDWNYTGDFTITVGLKGGYPQYNHLANYTVQGDINTSLKYGESASAIFPEDGINIYEVTGIDEFGCGNITVADSFECIKTPIQWLYFNGILQANGNLLQWATATETNSNIFNLQRSNDGGLNYQTIATIKAAGNSIVNKTYQYLDTKAPNLAYYKVQEIDNNGNKYESNTIVLQQNNTANKPISIINNYTTQQITIHGNALANSKLSIYDITGKLVDLKNIELSPNNTFEITFNIKNYSSGIYFAVLNTTKQTDVIKFVKP